MQRAIGRIIRGVRGTRALGWMAAGSVLAGAVAPAAAQCQSGWIEGPDIPATGFGTNGIVKAIVSWDPDGAGPLPPVLVVGGQFTIVGGTTSAANIAIWNGSGWQAMSTGMTGTGASVQSLCVFNGDLFACGTFANTGGLVVNNIARWNGSWNSVGGGLTSTGTPIGRAMAAFSGQLYVTGSFSTAGATAVSGIARWNGASWSAPPAGGGGGMYAMCVYNNELYTGGNGSFDGTVFLERFDGTNWFTTPGTIVGKMHPSDTFPYIRALAVYDNKLIVGGNFRDVAGFLDVDGICSWDGNASTWGPLSTGMDEPVFALANVNGQLYAGGLFNTAGNVLSPRVARWDGAWHSAVTSVQGGATPSVQALGSHNGEAFAGGLFTGFDGVSVNNLAHLPGTGVAPVANATPVRAMSGAVTTGGDFTVNLGGGVIAQHCVAWGGGASMGAYSDLGGFTGPNGSVYALGTYSNSPFMIPFTVFGGSFSAAGGATANNIATWRLSSWGTMGSGFNGTVRAVINYNGSFYAAGDFTMSGAVSCLRIARYVSGAWQPVAGGFNGSVNCLYVLNGWLYAGGTFTTAGGNPVNYLAAYNGGTWQSVADGLLGNGTGSGVYCMTSYSGGFGGPFLVVGGKFRTSFSNIPNLASIGSIVAFFSGYGTGWNDTVRAATMYEGDLVVGGDFTMTPGGAMNRIARYDLDGAGWQAMGTGVDATVYCLLPTWGSELQVGGAFSTAGGLASPHWARWNTSGRPAITQQPSGQTALGCDATFTVETPISYTGLTYQWRRDGVDLVNGPSATGAVIVGANSATLSMTNLSVADEGAYSCVVTNACGSTTSSSATLNVCGADFNCDGFIDPLDYNAYINGFENGDPSADYNRDGFLDPLDYNAFINDFEAGC